MSEHTPHLLSAQVRSVDELTPAFICEWERLSRNAIEPNPFLHPQFVLAQLAHLPGAEAVSIWTVESAQGELLLLAVFRDVWASKQIPFPHLSDDDPAFKFQGGMLLHRHYPRVAMSTFLQHLKTTRFRHGLVLNSMCIDSSFSEQFYTSSILTGFQVQLRHSWSRACLDLTVTDGATLLETSLSKNRRKSLRKALSRLDNQGPVSFRAVEDPCDVPRAIDQFLDLEKRGWKNTSGTALACDPAHKNFFTAAITRMAEDRQVMFGELLTGKDVVASTCNLISGNTLFAYKIGWDPESREGSPGVWAEIELARYIAMNCPEIRLLNSCATAGSYLDRLWPQRIAMGNVVLTQSHRAVLFSGVQKTIRSVKRLLWPNRPAITVENDAAE
ncbi:GNAT family N-acetyltransferase [Planctomicrobium sp. SH661]|uniref:GNAT family N-acetyltransferase n=1 Tax=Planctomicrobium sp. SH661 TaxID=3448124 RepID=UPI003F5B4B5E